jgi:hypothetical protein
MLIRVWGSTVLLLLLLCLHTWALEYGPQEEPDREFSHTIIKLNKRDDALARSLARDMGMVIRVRSRKISIFYGDFRASPSSTASTTL